VGDIVIDMAGLGDFASMCVGSVKGVSTGIKAAGSGFGSLFGNIDGLIRKT
tara:strand:+ start:115 stop:267 length:153 start_codon:yes stop_codon:yes gene_type:complete